MDRAYPIYTAEAQCQDCYKCVRRCPAKAIRVSDGHAKVAPELCVACGTCVAACPAKAKIIRNDLGRAKLLLSNGKRVFLSLAPSWVGAFPGVNAAQLTAAARRLGFAGVSETALGAQEVSAATAALLRDAAPGVYLSSACPAAVDYVRRFMPEFAAAITPFASPMLAHAALLRSFYGGEIGVVFAGPCVAKKNESDRHPALVDIALTYRALRTWFEEAGIALETLAPEPGDVFAPEAAFEGGRYPIEGGMLDTLRGLPGLERVQFAAVSGLEELRNLLEGFQADRLAAPIFIECLACPGGCINGPVMEIESPALARHLAVTAYAPYPAVDRVARVGIGAAFPAEPAGEAQSSEKDLLEALARVGKRSKEDELNCAGCGYDSCRTFARALLEGKAEPEMCVSYMRKLAQKKANALLASMPSGVVIVDRGMRIIECNERFAGMFGEDNAQVYEVCPGLKGCLLDKVVPFAQVFRTVLDTGRERHCQHFRFGAALYDITVFTIEAHEVVGAVIQDVTRQELRRDQIAQRANEVIAKNLSTVQEIACKLGEHMADTEILLRSIAEGFAADAPSPRTDAAWTEETDHGQ